MLTFDVFNNPNKWESNEEWTNFFWRNNVLGLYKIISDCLLSQFSEGLMRKYTEEGFHYKSEESIVLIRFFENNKLLVLKKFSFSLWVVINNKIDNDCEKLEIKLNEKSFTLNYENSQGKLEQLFIPRILETYEEMVRNSWEITNLINKILEIDTQIKKYEKNYNPNNSSQVVEYFKKEIDDGYKKITEINNEIRNLENNLKQRLTQEKILNEQELDLAIWGSIVKKILKTKLFDLSVINKNVKPPFIHVIEVDFTGVESTIQTIPSNRIH